MQQEKTETLNVKLTPWHKDLLWKFAQEDQRNMTTELAWLLEQEAARRLRSQEQARSVG